MGHLTLLIGPMFSRKTNSLLRHISKCKENGDNVLAIVHSSDTRYGINRITSHDQWHEDAIGVDKLETIDEQVRSGKYQVVAIDEGQFFTDLYQYITMWADELPIRIIIAGLDGTSERKPFGDLLQLIPHAEDVKRLNGWCSVCKNGTDALYSKYIGPTKHTEISVGGSELYRPVCRRHYLEP